MAQRFERLEIRTLGRRLFLKVGGAVALSALVPACAEPAKVSSPNTQASGVDGVSAEDTTATDPTTPVDTADSGPAPEVTDTSTPPKPCEGLDPDPMGGGADAYPWESVPPPADALAISPITDNASFYVTSYFGVAQVDPCEWRLSLSVRGEVMASIDLESLLALEGQEREQTLQCIESGPGLMKMDNAMWTGMPLTEVLSMRDVAPDSNISGIRLLAADSYEVGLPIEELNTPVWLVWKMNGELIPPEHGFPVRLLCPDRYGWQNVKQLVQIDFVEGDPSPDYQKAWATHYRLQGLIANPESVALSADGETVRLLGKAYAGSDPVTWVGVSTDGGDTYVDAELTYSPGPDRWTLWRFEWQPPGPGSYTLKCACETQSGDKTKATSGQMFPFEDGMAVDIEVS